MCALLLHYSGSYTEATMGRGVDLRKLREEGTDAAVLEQMVAEEKQALETLLPSLRVRWNAGDACVHAASQVMPV